METGLLFFSPASHGAAAFRTVNQVPTSILSSSDVGSAITPAGPAWGPAEKNVFTVQKASTSKTGNVCRPVVRASTRRRCLAYPTKCVEDVMKTA